MKKNNKNKVFLHKNLLSMKMINFLLQMKEEIRKKRFLTIQIKK